jgi:hypothetical protein
MCWNKYVSFITLIIGTVFTILLWVSYPQKTVRVIACVWQFVLFMQLFEGLSWVSKETNDERLSSISTIGAFVFNVLQPVIVSLLCIMISESTPLRILLSILICIYTIVLLYSVSSTSFSSSLYEQSDTCHHLQLYWWGKFSPWVFVFYNILIVVSCLSFTPLRLGLFQLGYIFLTFFLSSWFYACTYGSIWCWFAAFAPLCTFIYLQCFPLASDS